MVTCVTWDVFVVLYLWVMRYTFLRSGSTLCTGLAHISLLHSWADSDIWVVFWHSGHKFHHLDTADYRCHSELREDKETDKKSLFYKRSTQVNNPYYFHNVTFQSKTWYSTRIKCRMELYLIAIVWWLKVGATSQTEIMPNQLVSLLKQYLKAILPLDNIIQ